MIEPTRRWGGWWVALPRLIFVLVLWAPLPIVLLFALQVSRFATELPPVPDITTLAPSYGSRVETMDGWFLGGARATEPVPYEELPRHVVAAFLAAEDEDFFSHQAYSMRGIVRAAIQNVREGRPAEGASTITQQVARQFLTTEKTYERKVKELLLARRIEATYSKGEILRVYLGSVFAGHTAHGVTQAAWLYFGKSPTDLTVAEAATIAGLLPAPSVYSPFVSLDAARAQRRRVLRRMHDIGTLSMAEVERYSGEPIELRRADEADERRMPRAFQAGLRAAHNFGEEVWGSGGMTFVVPHEPVPQAIARSALQRAIEELDRRQGWRGAPARALDATSVDEAIAAQPPGRIELARIVQVTQDEAEVFARDGRMHLTLADNGWAEPAETPRHYKRPVRLRDMRDALREGDVVFVERGADGVRLWQRPAYEGAFVDVDTTTGRLHAAVGGFDGEVDTFDRVFQGCRQPGSVFKPIVYAQALSAGFTAASMLRDVPVEVATGRGDTWRPRNADRDFRGFVTLADALAWSRNIPTVNLMDRLGPRHVVARAKQLGVTESVLDTTSSVSLGASCVRPYEMVQVYGAFQRHGRTLRVSPLAYWIDPHGATRDDAMHFAIEDWRTSARLERLARVQPLPDRGVSENVAYIMLDLLRRVVTSGTAHELPDDWLVAGKTGTTNEFDAWFVGFDGLRTTATWVGSDKNTRPLGRGEHGATAAMPAFRYYGEVFARRSGEGEEFLPAPPAGIEIETIDRATGLRTPPGESGIELPFVAGTAPREVAPTRGTRQAQQVDELIYDF